MKIKPFNVIDHTDLPVITLDSIPEVGDPVEIKNEMCFACETKIQVTGDVGKLGLIPLVVRNPSGVADIGDYIKCLSIAHRRVRFMKDNNICDFSECDEMVIT